MECRSDLNYADTPLAFQWESRRLQVEEVLQRWRTPQGRGFRVKAGEGRVFELIYDEAKDQWQIRILY